MSLRRGPYANYSPKARAIARLLDTTAGPVLGTVSRGLTRLRRRDSGRGPGILLLRADHLGDWLMATPAIRALRARFPEAEIHAVVSPAAAEAAALDPDLDGRIVFRAPWYEPRAEPVDPVAFIGLAARIAAGRGTRRPWDIVVEMRGDPRLLAIVAFSGAGRRIGFGNIGLGAVLTDRVPLETGHDHLRRNLDVLAPLGIERPDDQDALRPVLVVPDPEAARARAILHEVTFPNTPYAIVAPGSARPHQRWGVEGFARAADGLADMGLAVLLTGAPSDAAVVDAVRARAKFPVIPLAGRTGVAEFAALASGARVCLANDSGAVHVAISAGCPVVAIFGPTSPELSFPYAGLPGCIAVAGPARCFRPCFRAGCDDDHGYSAISPADVIEKCRQAMAARPAIAAGMP